MKIAIIGYGVEGRAAYNYWRDGNEITICDQNSTLSDTPDDVTLQLGEHYLEDLDDFDLVVRSPFVRPDALTRAGVDPEKITSNTNEFFRVCPTKNIIGITGTKGKGTTSTLVTELLRASGKTVHLGGNIGIPALDLLAKPISADDWVVLELSSFQLMDLRQSPAYAICLMIIPEHLDWHLDVNEYLRAKKQLFAHQLPTDHTVYFADNGNSVAVAAAGHGIKLPYFAEPGARVENGHIVIDGKKICDTDDLKLVGAHNWQNVCAALTLVWLITQDIAPLRETLKTFSGLPYRLEVRGTINDRTYYNDSFAANSGATLAALAAVAEPKVMILGGFERGLELTELAQVIARPETGVRAVLVIGQSGPRLIQELQQQNFTAYTYTTATNMKDIVHQATALSEPGDAIVLSPGFASFDMFKNFQDRGDKFNEAVEALRS